MSDNFRTAFAAVQQASAELAPPPPPRIQSYAPPAAPQPATRQGQREIVAATLAAGIMASTGEPMNAVEAVALWREVMGEAWQG